MDTSRSTALSEQTVLDRLVRSGIAQDRAIEHIRDGWVLVDGVKVRDPEASAEPPVKVELLSIHRH